MAFFKPFCRSLWRVIVIILVNIVCPVIVAYISHRWLR